ncbi:MAG: hypothetical protein FWE09_02770, partial [Treponema sp.]|nr:hypothetical protein [Treponema sp.]
SLLDAIRLSAERLAADIPAGSRVAIVAFDSESDGLSAFIMDELAGALIDLGVEVADRRNLAAVLGEMDLHLSGLVSDETALSLGRFLGAEFVVTGELRSLGSFLRLSSRAIGVETAVLASSPRFDAPNDASMREMIAALSARPLVAGDTVAGVEPGRGALPEAPPRPPSQVWESWSSVAAGGNHSAVIGADGSLWTWGANNAGQVGDGTTEDRDRPVRIGAGQAWASVSAGAGFTSAIASDGSLWLWGNNANGQLGDGTTTNRALPVRLDARGGPSSWTSVSAGSSHALAIGSDGSLWAWGSGTRGQLGNGRMADSRVPVRVGESYGWAHASAGDGHSAAIMADGSLWTWGSNSNGQLGSGASGPRTERSSPVRVGSDNDWAFVSAGWAHTVAVRTDLSLWAWGSGGSGRLGDGTAADQAAPTRVGADRNWATVSAGREHTVAIGADGSLWAWGSNADGRIGDGFATGGGWRNDRHVPTRIAQELDWAFVCAGWGHTVAAATEGSAWAWGANNRGQLGDGQVADPRLPVRTAGVPRLLVGDGR